MDTIVLQLAVAVLIFAFELVESRYCTYFTTDGLHTIFCNSYEYCCGNACCRPATIKFYHLWYFWLTVILILLLCSGGSWWYRFRYRNHLLSQRSPFTTVTGPNIPTPRPGTGAVYYPGADRVYLHSQPKDPNTYLYMRVSFPPSSYRTGPMPASNDFSYQTSIPPPLGSYPSAAMPPPAVPTSLPPPPPYGVPPPSYDSIMQSAYPCPNPPSATPHSNDSHSGLPTSQVQQSQHTQVPPAAAAAPSTPNVQDQGMNLHKCANERTS